MKINIHCHSNYSDGQNIYDMAKEHKNQGFSAFVVTDHVYPGHLLEDLKTTNPKSITTYDKYQKQYEHLKNISEELDFPCIQGIELAIYGEEVLVFGEKAVKDIFNYMSKLNLNEQEKHAKTIEYQKKLSLHLLDILNSNKENSAIILCHPHLMGTPQWVLEPIYNIIDGYEFQNGRHYYFTDETNIDEKLRWDRDVPNELISKKKFYNSDAHYISEVGVNKGNFHAKKITTLDDLVSFIKTPNEPNTLSLIYQNCER